MPYELLVQQNQLVHNGLFARPLFELWGDGKTILRGLFEALSPFGATLPDMHIQSVQATPADPVVTVNIGVKGTLTFRLDRIESTFFNFTDEFLREIPKIIESSARWIRAAVPSFKFSSHGLIYSSHSQLSKYTIEEVLKSVGTKTLKSGGVDKGTGAIFHWAVPQKNWTTQLVLDRSVVLAGGLYMMFNLLVTADAVEYDSLAKEGRKYLDDLLAELGLVLSSASS